MRIDRYVHDERLTWGAGAVLLLVAGLHAAGITRLFLTPTTVDPEAPAPVFEITLQKLPPPRLPPEVQQADKTPADTMKQQPRQTRPVPIIVDTPTTDPVPPDTQVKKYQMGDELLPGDPGPAMPAGTAGDSDTSDAGGTPLVKQLKLVDMTPPVYPPKCLRLGIEGKVRIRILVGEDGRPQEVSIAKSSGEAALDQSAMDAVRKWRFDPARRDGVPIRAWVIVPIGFELTD
jgi:periplasmic protein TonB